VVANARGQEPEFIFKTVHLFKVIQFIAFSMWYYSHFGLELLSLPSFGVCLTSMVLLAIGQTLNALVWYRIGVQGVVSDDVFVNHHTKRLFYRTNQICSYFI
jgi:hypothetical protein